jgi:imidazoleglycerol-phosphate dehydratase
MGIKTAFARRTKETDISIELCFGGSKDIDISTSVPFLDHMLNGMAFHGGFGLKIKATGDKEVDFHHTVEDTGLALGEALHKAFKELKTVKRYGHSVIPMDDAISEVTIDVSGRPALKFIADFPQSWVGNFDINLIKEFLIALSNKANICLHACIRYGENSHHMAESLFKALGKAINEAYKEEKEILSTKGTI